MVTFPHGGASLIWRAFVVDGVDASGAWRVRKEQVRPYMTLIQDILIAASMGLENEDIEFVEDFDIYPKNGAFRWDDTTANRPPGSGAFGSAMFLGTLGNTGFWIAADMSSSPRVYFRSTRDGGATYGSWSQFITAGFNQTMTGILTHAAELRSTSPNHIRLTTGNISVILRSDSNNFYFVVTDPNDTLGNFNSLRPFLFNKATGAVVMQHGLTVDSDLRIGGVIGRTSIGTIFLRPQGAGSTVSQATYDSSGNLVIARDLTVGRHIFGATYIEQRGPGGTVLIDSNTSDSIGTHRSGRYQARRGTGSDHGYGFQDASTAGLRLRTDSDDIRVMGVDGSQKGRFQSGTTMNEGTTLATRAMGDVRWAAASSERYKGDIESATRMGVLEFLDTHTWIWGGELPETDERVGERGFGLVVEQMEQVFPEAVTYQYDDQGQRRPNGLDSGALFGMLINELKDAKRRIAELEMMVNE